MHFNSHAHVERDTRHVDKNIINADFNSHAHVERDFCKFLLASRAFCISTHTLMWSVTLRSPSFVSSFRDFNSHAHVERDLVAFNRLIVC